MRKSIVNLPWKKKIAKIAEDLNKPFIGFARSYCVDKNFKTDSAATKKPIMKQNMKTWIDFINKKTQSTEQQTEVETHTKATDSVKEEVPEVKTSDTEGVEDNEEEDGSTKQYQKIQIESCKVLMNLISDCDEETEKDAPLEINITFDAFDRILQAAAFDNDEDRMNFFSRLGLKEKFELLNNADFYGCEKVVEPLAQHLAQEGESIASNDEAKNYLQEIAELNQPMQYAIEKKSKIESLLIPSLQETYLKATSNTDIVSKVFSTENKFAAAFMHPNGSVFIKDSKNSVMTVYSGEHYENTRTISGLPESEGSKFIFSEDGKYMAASEGSDVSIWSTEGKLINKFLNGTDGNLPSLKLNFKSKNILAIFDGHNKVMKFWNFLTAECLKEFQLGWNLDAVDLSPDGNYCVKAFYESSQERVTLYDVDERKIRSFAFYDLIYDVNFSFDGKLIVINGYGDYGTWIYSVDDPQKCIKLKKIVINPDKNSILHWGEKFSVYSLESDSNVKTFENGSLIKQIAVSPNQNVFISVSCGIYSIRSMQSGVRLINFYGKVQNEQKSLLYWSQDGTKVGHKKSEKKFVVRDLFGQENRELLQKSSYANKLALFYYYKKLIKFSDIKRNKRIKNKLSTRVKKLLKKELK